MNVANKLEFVPGMYFQLVSKEGAYLNEALYRLMPLG
jgi:hypothetical protein